MSTSSTFVLYALNLENRVKGELTAGESLYYSSLSKAQKAARAYRETYSFLYEPDCQRELYCLVLEEYQMNADFPRRLSMRVLSPEGKLVDSSFCDSDDVYRGRPESFLRHQVGDIVEVPVGDRLCLGIVLERPLSQSDLSMKAAESQCEYGADDSYTLITYPSMEVDYVDAPLVFKPMHEPTAGVSRCLKDALAQYKDYGLM